MRTSELLRLVYINITQNKFKTIMTSIGIIVGAATIVMVIAIGKGGQADVAEQFKNLNAGAVDISYEGEDDAASGGGGNREGGGPSGGSSGGGMPSGNGAPSGGGFSGGGPSGDKASGNFDFSAMAEMFGFGVTEENEKVTLTEDDVENVLENVSGVSDATISYTTKSDVEGGDLEEAASYTIAGVKSNYMSISNLEMSVGEFISDSDDENKEKVCILGASVAKEIFGSAIDAYGSVLYIDNRLYVVNGVLAEMGTVASGISPDEAVFIPYDTGVKYLVGSDVSPTLTAIAEDVDNVDTMIADITALFLESYPNTEFTYSDAGSKMEAASASNEILTMLLMAMAAIVFVVGGIGIMNVLFVSVKERTNEIGILKAIGGSQKTIMFEFLLEAAAISLIGGTLGLLLSLIVAPIAEKLGASVLLTPSAFVIAMVFAVATGTVFGIYPAYKASALVPVEALSAE